MTAIVLVIAMLVVAAAAAIIVSSRRRPDTAGPVGKGPTLEDAVGAVLAATFTDPDPSPADEQRRSPEFGTKLARLYRSVDPLNFDLRWALVNEAAEAEPVVAVDFLASVASSELPGEFSGDEHRFPGITRELSIRLRAVEGLRAHASRGVEGAVLALRSLATSPHFTIRKASLLSLRTLARQEADLRALHALLRDGEEFILDTADTPDESMRIIDRQRAESTSSRTDGPPSLHYEGPTVDQPTRRNGRRKPPRVPDSST